jgi:hypothetical protein
MAVKSRVDAFLARYGALSDDARRELHRTPEFDFLMARLKYGPDESVPQPQLDLALELELRYPYPLEHYRSRAEAARRSSSLADRLASSVPFSAGTRA